MTQNTTAVPRLASKDGEILSVVTLSSGCKALADFADRDEIVELQLHRNVRLVGLPEHIQREFAVSADVKAIHIRIPHKGSAKGFSFDGSNRRAVRTQDLPDGQLIYVLPDTVEAMARILWPLPMQELTSRVAAYAY